MSEYKTDRLRESGFWHLPEDPNLKHPGELTFTPEDGAYLRLTVPKSNMDLDRDRLSHEVLHGDSSSGEVLTAVGCQELDHSWVSTKLETREFLVERVFQSVHFSRRQLERLHTAIVEFDLLDPWLGRTGIELQHDHSFEEYRITYRPPRWVVTVPMGDMRLSISVSLASLPIQPKYSGTLALEERARIVVTPTEPKAFGFFSDAIEAVRDFLSVACLMLACRESTRVMPDSESRQVSLTQQARVFERHVLQTTERQYPVPEMFLFRFDQVEEKFPSMITAWMTAANRLKHTRHLYMASLYSSQMYIEHRFLCLVQALEAYCRRTPDDSYVAPEVFAQDILPVLQGAVPEGLDSDFRQAIMSRLKFLNEYSLRKRLKLLYSEHRDALDFLVPDTMSRIDSVVEARNQLTHYSDDTVPSQGDYEEYSKNSKLLRLMLELSFLKEMGLESTEVCAMAKSCWRYRRWFGLPIVDKRG